MKPHAILAVIALAAILVGCGPSGDAPEVGKVVGTLMVDGNPAANINVTFSPTDGGRSSQATTNEKGEYELIYSTSTLGAKVGPHKVSIAKNDGMSGTKDTLPKKYTQMTKDVEVKGGNNTIELIFP